VNVQIIEERMRKIDGLSLKSGAHSPDSTFCVMEAVAFVAGEKWSDSPECVCPVIAAFMRSWNDALPSDTERDRLLKPLISKIINTRSKKLENRRALMAADWLVRVNTPAWLRLAGLAKQAELLAALPEITSMEQIPSIREPIEAVRRDANAARAAAWAAAGDAAGDAARDAARAAARAAAWAAARAAAWAAARDAAWDAARDAARDAAWAAARDAARDAARAAAWDAARAAAWDAAWDAARDAAGAAALAAALAAARAAAWAAAWAAANKKIAATKEELQLSAVKLVERMASLV